MDLLGDEEFLIWITKRHFIPKRESYDESAFI